MTNNMATVCNNTETD